ncbi:hypothetical protein HRJ34_14760 [Rhizorhabdus wittichii]|uniref:Uncharacterized protein n=1 Tax=Rhizorhabdus wittichii TaxID=160791 RepID=A0A975HBS7_9SPHN|nr:hypothetical protein [Rhizorhabdus wittichii]QTH19636.1 hypothetical protein HRJ34_14760 [Rhizorhabdus wittichii]
MAVAAIALAGAGKPWTQERFSQCLSRVGASALDPDEGISSINCRERDSISNDATSVADLMIDRYVFVGWNKKQPHTRLASYMLIIDYNRMQTILGGDAAAGIVGFNRLSILWPDGLQEYYLKIDDFRVKGCSTIGSGVLRTSSCSYQERSYMPISAEALDKFKKIAQASTEIKLPIKLFSKSGEAVEAYICVDEVVATAAAAGI